jgi:hypothetical protein
MNEQHTVTARLSCGAYVARMGRVTASSTHSPAASVTRAAEKYAAGRQFAIEAIDGDSAHGHRFLVSISPE